MAECPHYNIEIGEVQCLVAEVGGRHADLRTACEMRTVTAPRTSRPEGDVCYRYQRARADALAAELEAATREIQNLNYALRAAEEECVEMRQAKARDEGPVF